MSKTMWSPWRIKYIEDGLKERGCIFCNRIEKSSDNDEDNLILFRGEKAFVIMNAYPYNNAHLMVLPKRHVANIEDLSEEEITEMMVLVQRATKSLRKIYKPDGFNIGINMGKAAGAGVEAHIHIHIVPRWNGDTNFMTVIGDVRVIPEDLISSYKKIKENF